MGGLLASVLLTWPFMLWGMAGAALPIVAHLLNRRTRRKLVFPCADLLLEAHADRSSIQKLRKPLLLLLRVLLIAVLALAFARPVWVAPLAGSEDGAVRTTIVLIDRSASTRAQAGGLSVFQQLQQRARAALSLMQPGRDLVQLIGVDAHPQPLYPKPIPNISLVNEDLSRMEPAWSSANWVEALRLAAAELDKAGGPRRILVASDLQRASWQRVLDAGSFKLTAGEIRFLEPPVLSPGNVSLSDLKIVPARPLAGQVAQVSVQVHRHGTAAGALPLTLYSNGRAVVRQDVAAASLRRQEVRFDLGIDTTGFHELEVRGAPDDMAFDDSAFGVAEAVDQSRVLLIGEEDPQQPIGWRYFLGRALAPEGEGRDRFLSLPVSPVELNDEHLKGVEVVVLDASVRLSSQALLMLRRFVEKQGGGLLVHWGPGSARAVVEGFESAGEGFFLPALPLGWLSRPADEPHHLQPVGLGTPRLAGFDLFAAEVLEQSNFAGRQSLQLRGDDSEVLLRWDDQTEAMLYRPAKLGRVVLANFSLEPRFSDLPRRGIYVALMHALMDLLRPQSSAATVYRPGDQLNFEGRSRPGLVNWNHAGGAVVEGRLDIEGPAFRATGRAEVPGFYRLQSDAGVMASEAVNINPVESRLEVFKVQELESLLAGSRAMTTAGHPGAGEPIDRTGRELWSDLIILGLILMGLEVLLTSLGRK